MTGLFDRFGRRHVDLRVSVTDRCNFRCTYCMPAEGLEWQDRSKLLEFDEIFRVVRLLADRFGLASVRLTGGEPTLRKNLPELVSRLGTTGVELSLTTNGATLDRFAQPLRSAGLHRVNVSLDTLKKERFIELTLRDRRDEVLAGIAAAHEVGFDWVKVNVMLIDGVNDDEILDFLAFGANTGSVVRFIEFMPLDAQEKWGTDRVVSADRILTCVRKSYEVEELRRGSSPAARYRYTPLKGTSSGGEFGIIASVTEPFCEACDRMRLTSDGQLRNCLFAADHLDIRQLLRSGADDDALAAAIVGEVERKRAGHTIGDVHFIRPTKSMSQVGG